MNEAPRTRPKGQWPGPSPIAEEEIAARAWGPGRVFGGLLALLGLTFTVGGVIAVADPPPTFDPVGVATVGEQVLALDADADEVVALGAGADDELDAVAKLPVASGSEHLAAARMGDGDDALVAVAGPSGRVDLLTWRIPATDGAGSADAASTKSLDLGADVRGLAAFGEGDRTLLAVATLAGEVRLFEVAADGSREDATIDLGTLPEAVALADLSGDNLPEVVVGADDGTVVPYSRNEAGWRPGPELDLGEGVSALGGGPVGGGGTVAAAEEGAEEIELLEPSGGDALASGPRGDVRAQTLALAVGPAGGGEVAAAVDDGAVVTLERSGSDLDVAREYVPRQSLGARLGLQLVLALGLVFAAFVFAARGAGFAAPRDLGLRRPLRSPWMPAVAAYVAYLAGAFWLAILIQPQQEDLTRELGFGESPLGDVASAILIVGIAPLTEELFFRGFMYGGLRRRMPWIAAAAVSALIWAAFHFTGAGSGGVVAQLAIFGVVLAWLYEKTGSIWPGIAIHALNNAVAFTLLTAS